MYSKISQNQKRQNVLFRGMHSDISPTAIRGSSLSKIHESERVIAEYQRLLEELHPDFCKKLLSRAPALTPMELKVCILTRAFLDTKESASLLAVSESTVESHRWHARCKLGIHNRGLNLMSVLHAI
jgi:DNA-binding CsgD family transcriptional regulator